VIPLKDARSFVLNACPVLATRIVPIDDALGCVAATSVRATEQVPPFSNSSMDGYAIRSSDTMSASGPDDPARLDVIDTILAGAATVPPIGPGQAMRIMTGGLLPKGADAVCMFEDCLDDAGGAYVAITRPVSSGTAVRSAGQDVEIGQIVLDAGTAIGPVHLGVLANQGIARVEVHPRPRIGVLSTGDELFSDPGPLPPGKIRDANRHSLLALIRREGWDPVDLGVVGDDEVGLSRVLDQASTLCDAIVTSGGVSVGDRDIVKVVLHKRSAGIARWMQVAIRPGKPLAFALLAGTDTPVFGLPGNPVSAMVSFELFVRPAGRRLGGHLELERPVIPAIAEEDFCRRQDGKTHFLRSWLRLDGNGTWWVRAALGQESNQLLAMAGSNSLAVVPDGEGVRRGGSLHALLTDVDRLQLEPRHSGSCVQ
jgi:molybdopterin molybdotransferase